MSRTADYDSVEPPPPKALDARVSYFLGLFMTGLLAVGVVAGVIGGIQYFNAEVVGVGKGTTGSAGAPGSDLVTALPPTLNAATLLTAVTAALANVSLPRGPSGFNATCMCPLVRNGTDSTVPGPAGPQGPQGIMGPVYYSNGTAPSTFSHITVVAGGTWTGGPVFDDVTITHNLTVYNAVAANTLLAGSAGQFKVYATGAVQGVGFVAGAGDITTTGTVYGGVVSVTGTAQNSLQTQGGIQAVNNIASTTGSVTTAAASMSSTGVFAGTTAQISGDVNGKRGVFATDLLVGGGAFSVNSTGAVTARSLQTVGTISTPLASLDATGMVKGVTVWTPLASINAAGMINGTAVLSSGTIATPLASMNAAGFVNGTAVWSSGTIATPLASMNAAGVVNGTNIVGLQSVSTPILDMSSGSGGLIKQVSNISFTRNGTGITLPTLSQLGATTEQGSGSTIVPSVLSYYEYFTLVMNLQYLTPASQIVLRIARIGQTVTISSFGFTNLASLTQTQFPINTVQTRIPQRFLYYNNGQNLPSPNPAKGRYLIPYAVYYYGVGMKIGLAGLTSDGDLAFGDPGWGMLPNGQLIWIDGFTFSYNVFTNDNGQGY